MVGGLLVLAVLLGIGALPVRQWVSVNGIVIDDGRPPLLAAPIAGRIDTVNVVDGQRVAAGEILLRVVDAEVADRFRTLSNRIDVLRLQVERLSAVADGRVPDFDAVVAGREDLKRTQRVLWRREVDATIDRVTGIRDAVRVLRRDVAALREQQERRRGTVAELEAQRRARQDLVDRGQGQPALLAQSDAALAEARAALQAGEAALLQTETALAAAEADEGGLRDQVTRTARSEIRIRRVELQAAEDRLARARRNAEAGAIRAPVAGRVTLDAAVAPGARLVRGQALARVAPDGGARLRAVATIPMRQFPHIQPGLPVEVAVAGRRERLTGSISDEAPPPAAAPTAVVLRFRAPAGASPALSVGTPVQVEVALRPRPLASVISDALPETVARLTETATDLLR